MDQPDRPVPVADADSRPYWDAAAQHRLEFPRCGSCSTYIFPPRSRCPRCLSTDLSWARLSGRGEVYSFTVVRVAVVGGFELPYVVAEIELAEQPGLRMLANVVGCAIEDVALGRPVEVIFEDRDPEYALPQFRLAEQSQTSSGI